MSPLTRRPALLLTLAVVVLLLSSTAVAVTRGAPPQRIAFLARADNPVDALAASSVAAQLGGVVLLSDTAALSPQAREALEDFAPDLVVLAGGPAALSAQVQADVEDLGVEVVRVAGSSRLETAAAIVAFLADRPPAFLPVDGTAADALHAAMADAATTAEEAGHATTADTAASATTAGSATTAQDAAALGGVPASAYGLVVTASGSGSQALQGGIFNTNTVLTLEVVAPADGVLLVHGDANITGGGHGSFSCSVMEGSASYASALGITDPVLMTETGTCGATGARAVQAGTHTLTLVLRVEEGGHSVAGRNLVAMFTPNAG